MSRREQIIKKRLQRVRRPFQFSKLIYEDDIFDCAKSTITSTAKRGTFGEGNNYTLSVELDDPGFVPAYNKFVKVDGEIFKVLDHEKNPIDDVLIIHLGSIDNE